jgi:two-component system C4-dicarboxylate transport response regulator DctD
MLDTVIQPNAGPATERSRTPRGACGPVLFVDDEGVMREAVAQWLELAGFEVIVRSRAVEALAILSPEFPGVLVSDLKMDGMDGFALLEQSQRIDAELPVIMITGHGDDETALRILAAGAYDFIEKPFAPEQLLRVIRCAGEKRTLILEDRNQSPGTQKRSDGEIGSKAAARAGR